MQSFNECSYPTGPRRWRRYDHLIHWNYLSSTTLSHFMGLESSAPLLWQSKISHVYFEFFVVFCRCQCHLVNTWYHLMHSITPTMSLITFTVYQCQLIHRRTSKDRQSKHLLKVTLDHRVHSVPLLFMLCDRCVWQWLVGRICFWKQLCGIGMYTGYNL
jgi:hypothetical protein